MELYENGVITDADTDGVPLEFGNAEALTIMAEKTGRYEGFGRMLGMGSKRLAEKYGRPEVSITIKGQEIPGYDARALQGMGLGYATSPRGACHMKHDVFEEDMDDVSGNGKAKPCKDSQDRIAAVDSTGLCWFTTSAWGLEEFAVQVDAACEGEWTAERLTQVGERTFNMERRFNLAAGLTRADDTLPQRFLRDPGAERYRRGQGQRAGPDAAGLLPGTGVDRRRGADQRDAEPLAGLSGDCPRRREPHVIRERELGYPGVPPTRGGT